MGQVGGLRVTVVGGGILVVCFVVLCVVSTRCSGVLSVWLSVCVEAVPSGCGGIFRPLFAFLGCCLGCDWGGGSQLGG